MTRLTPEVFWNAFSTEMKKCFRGTTKEKANIAYSDDIKWTKYLAEILKKIGEEKFGFTVAREHWPRVDTKYFSNEGEEWDEWAIEAAIEYENLPPPAWHDEACKLLQLLAGIKIIITYSYDEKYDPLVELKEFQKIYDSRRYHQEKDSWLFIFGPSDDIRNNKKNDFVAYKFDGIEITNITDGHKIFT